MWRTHNEQNTPLHLAAEAAGANVAKLQENQTSASGSGAAASPNGGGGGGAMAMAYSTGNLR